MRFREFGGYSEYRETNEYRKPTSEEISREMKESADRIQKLLDSIDLSDLEEEKEVNREAIYGIDQEIIRKEEVREIKYDDQKEKNELIEQIINEKIMVNSLQKSLSYEQEERKKLELKTLSELQTILIDYQKISQMKQEKTQVIDQVIKEMIIYGEFEKGIGDVNERINVTKAIFQKYPLERLQNGLVEWQKANKEKQEKKQVIDQLIAEYIKGSMISEDEYEKIAQKKAYFEKYSLSQLQDKLVSFQQMLHNLDEYVVEQKQRYINQIITAMINAGYINENSYTIQKEISDARSRLENNSLDELKNILMNYQNIDVREEKMCVGMNR